MSVIDNIVHWNISRNLNTFSAATETYILGRELLELQDSLVRGLDPVDDYCDLIVVCIGALHKLGYNPDKALRQTYYEINSRKGSIDSTTGKWEKDLNQDPSTLYKANYSVCKKEPL